MAYDPHAHHGVKSSVCVTQTIERRSAVLHPPIAHHAADPLRNVVHTPHDRNAVTVCRQWTGQLRVPAAHIQYSVDPLSRQRVEDALLLHR